MTRHRWIFLTVSLLLLFSASSQATAPSEQSLKEILAKNIEAAGEKRSMEKIENYSFSYGPTTYYLSNKGLMKMTEGSEPIITEVILIGKNQVKRNCFNKITELSGVQKSTYLSLARLWSGLFTLVNFEKKLELKGLKSFGPKNHYLLTTKVDDLVVEFYLDSEEYTLQRLVFKGYDEEQNKYEINHDFGPFQAINGVKIPSSWFSSQVGTRGNTVEVMNVKVNQTLGKDFFENLDVNVGEVEIGQGSLKGSIIESGFRRNMLTIATNWTDECIQRAGFKSGDKLILQIAESEIEIDFHESFPPRESIGPGSKFMVPNQSNENYLIYLIAPEFRELAEKLEPLLTIRLKRK
ncbi:MAG: hypothetical protein OEY25_02510 [Candidatus Aminicenantes bacterium]|nr:hypothetical protein [Candidatus Aminicenantes bacterium]MDH5705285.1 hypothetical protein [Candidatus Aminicenantes bacterium]